MVLSLKLKSNSNKIVVRKKYSCFIFGEGRKDTNFIKALRELSKFKYHTGNWIFSDDNASGSSAKTILEKCKRRISSHDFDLILCLIDLDDIKHKYPKSWKKEKENLEKSYSNITIIWQINSLEDELKKVIREQDSSKHKINKIAKENIDKFINSSYWKRILKPIQEREVKLKSM